MLATNTNTYRTIADDSYIGWAALDPLTDWDLFFEGSYDDAQVSPLLAVLQNVITNDVFQWVILAFWKISDYKAARGRSYHSYMVRDIYCVLDSSSFLD